MEKPFSTHAFDTLRLTNLLEVAEIVGWSELCQRALKPREPHPHWTRAFLQARYLCYETHRDPLREQALTDLSTFLAEEPSRLLGDSPLDEDPTAPKLDPALPVSEENP
jgi:arginine/ornithine N-succinyltransferase beta subunit